MGKALADVSKQFQPRSKGEFMLYPYAKSHWIHHAAYISEDESRVSYNLLCQLFEDGVIDVNSKDEAGWTPLSSAVWSGYKLIVKALLKTDKVNIEPHDLVELNPLEYWLWICSYCSAID